MTLGQVFNEGSGSGGFAVTIGGNNYILDPFTVNPEFMVIKLKSALGVSLKKQGIKVDATASATAQVAVDANNNPLWLQGGESFTDPDGDVWWVAKASKNRRSGEVFKQEIECELRLV